ncbi:uncharacterized protein DNG_07935 [Cephalotrichum gorgonifer]|uniref:Uncharacterized protein n=1 Tax=Cephalotrichum gorgonifer TaxID=2041049 RepID=A0AAE8SY11_9PEZI|nr:uncharacterized protein DNG_07935 [Cephalotrichum gorgonifer]
MLSLLKIRPRRSTESTKPFALAPLPTNPRPSEASEAAPTPAPSPPSPTTPSGRGPQPPKTFLHRFLCNTSPFCRNFTLPLPLAVVVLMAFVHISANQGFWRGLNRGKGDPGSMSWAPFWIGITYFLVYVPWWYVVWANYWRSHRKNKPFLSRSVHLGGEIAAIVVTTITLALTVLVSRSGETLIVGFSYVVTMAAFFGIQM